MSKENLIKRNYKIFLFIILIFALAIRLHFFIGFCCGDDMAYVNGAYAISEGKYKTTDIYNSRLPFVYPIAFFYRVFGVSDFTTVLHQILISLAGIVVIFYLGKLIFNEYVGLISAFLMSIFPLDIISSTMLLNDIVVSFYFSLSVYFFVLGEKKSNESKYYILSGIFYGISFLAKSSAIVFGGFYLVYYFFKEILNFNFFGAEKEQRFKIKKSYFFLVLLVLLCLTFFVYVFSKPNLIVTDSVNPMKPPTVQNATQLYGSNNVWINAFYYDEGIYWDIDTNSLTNRASRGNKGIVEELEYSLNNNSELHVLGKSLLVRVKEPYETVKCSDKKFTETSLKSNVGDVLCSETSNGNYAKIKIISVKPEKIGMKYELQYK